MGSYFTKKVNNYDDSLLVATLNYGGILNSPFEFFSDPQNYKGKVNEEQQISNLFKQLMSEYWRGQKLDKFKWNVGKIDQKLQKQRYTPLYKQHAGIQNDRLITKEQFQRNWDQQFDKALLTVKFKKDEQPTKQQRQIMKKFDLMCYHSIVKFLYPNIKKLDSSIANQKSQKYQELMKRFFSRAYLNEDKKIEKMIKVFKRNFHTQISRSEAKQVAGTKFIDIYFFQEPTKKFIDRLHTDKQLQEQFFIHGGEDQTCAILVKRSTFNNNFKTIDQIEDTNLHVSEWPLIKKIKQTAVLLCNDRYILLNVHLSSKATRPQPNVLSKNEQDVKSMKQTLIELQRYTDKYDIIMAGDTNSYVNNVDIEDYYIYPKHKTFITTRKKRTYLQPQFNKANEAVQECKDHIITNLKLLKRGTITIEIKAANDRSLLPTSDHPFDHFMVLGMLQK